MPDSGDNPLMYLVLAVGAGLLAYGVIRLITDLTKREDQRVGKRLTSYAASESEPTHLIRDVMSMQRSIVGRFLSTHAYGQAFRKMLMQADVPWPAHKVLSNIALATFSIVALCMFLNVQFEARIHWIVILILGAATAILPIVAIAVKRAFRLKKLLHQLPQVFDMLGQALRAGHALVTGIQLVGEQVPDPAGKEFARVYQEQNFGIKVEDALKNLAERVGTLDVKMFVTAVLIQRQTGGDLAEVLDKSGAVIRDRIEIAGQIKALTAEGRMSGWVLTVLPLFVGTLVNYINPNYLEPLLYGNAQWMLWMAVAGNFIGFLAIQKIIRIDY